MPTVFNPSTSAALITDITAANTNGQAANTINLTGTAPYVLTQINNLTNGRNGLPVIDSKVTSTLTINGNGRIIEHSAHALDFRLLDIAAGSHGSLVLENVTLEGGDAAGSGSSAEGGAIFNNGTLKIDGGVQFLDNFAFGTGTTGSGAGNSGAGGGIYCTAGSTLILDGNNLFKSCQARSSGGAPGKSGGNSAGGAIFDNTSTATSLSSSAGTVIEDCIAVGGNGGNGSSNDIVAGSGGSGSGGGLFINASSSTAKAALTGFMFDGDGAFGGAGGTGFSGRDGGKGGVGGSASGGAVAASGGTLIDSSFLLVNNCQAKGGPGGAGGNGSAASGGNGGNGGNADGGGIEVTNTILTLSASPMLESNSAIGGSGGNGGAAVGTATTGGNGGNSGNGCGGGLYATSASVATVTLKGALVTGNTADAAAPGNGGKGFLPDGGAGGSCAGAFGGGIYLNQKANLTSDTIDNNTARPSLGVLSQAGNGVDGGVGGSGGTGGGGGLYVAGGTVTVVSCFIENNQANGSAGGDTSLPQANEPGVGGAGVGAGVDIQGGTVTIANSTIDFNFAEGGTGGEIHAAGTGIAGGVQGGPSAGGGIYAGGGTTHLTLDAIQQNQANGGFGTGLHGAKSLTASGGGLYVVNGSVVTQDAFTLANLIGNADSNNDGNNNVGSGGPI